MHLVFSSFRRCKFFPIFLSWLRWNFNLILGHRVRLCQTRHKTPDRKWYLVVPRIPQPHNLCLIFYPIICFVNICHKWNRRSPADAGSETCKMSFLTRWNWCSTSRNMKLASRWWWIHQDSCICRAVTFDRVGDSRRQLAWIGDMVCQKKSHQTLCIEQPIQ